MTTKSRIQALHPAKLALLWLFGALVVAAVFLVQHTLAADSIADANQWHSQHDAWTEQAKKAEAQKDSVLAIMFHRDSIRYQFWLKGGPAPPPLDRLELGADSIRLLIVRSANERIPNLTSLAETAEVRYKDALGTPAPFSLSTAIWSGLIIALFLGIATWVWFGRDSARSV